MKTFISGSIGYDSVRFSNVSMDKMLGGSGVYASLAASIFSKVLYSGIIGKDFLKRDLDILKKKGISTKLIQKSKKDSFRWMARYSESLAKVVTVGREWNALLEYDPKKLRGKSELKECTAAFITKDDPNYQYEVIKSLPKNTIVVADTMQLWMVEKRKDLLKTLKHVDVFLVDEDEAHLVVGEHYSTPVLIEKIMELGPKVIIYKRGEYGFMMYGCMGNMIVPSYPMVYAVDPTGAGDALGGAIAGAITKIGKFNEPAMKMAALLGGMVASFVVEDYGVKCLQDLSLKEVTNRASMYLNQLPSLLNIQVEMMNGNGK